MEYLIGGILAGVIFTFGRSTGFDRDRVFYPTVISRARALMGPGR